MASKTFTRKGPDGKTQTRIAHDAAEFVQLRFDGWAEKRPQKAAEPAEPTKAAASSGSTK